MSITQDHKTMTTDPLGGALSLTYRVRLKKLAVGAYLAGGLGLAIIGLGAGLANAAPEPRTIPERPYLPEIYYYWGPVDRPDLDVPTATNCVEGYIKGRGMNIWNSNDLLSGHTTFAGTPDGAVAVQVTIIQDSYVTGSPPHEFIGGTTVVTSAFGDDNGRVKDVRQDVQSSISNCRR